ncbi:hypothetical protein ACFQ3B_05085 [Stackebrandtia endophytica]|uniref:hypothetical protein n=1 Tax=Stackebrandtia endophytica TaxID=1496996 RepID=UPI001FE8A8BF|nr:hypothetical protein [Stackebrandtia endophytica]
MSDSPMPRRQWLVTLAMPIEADGRADAAADFWEYVNALGPEELPIFISPSGDELAMQAYVGGAVTEMDPEED